MKKTVRKLSYVGEVCIGLPFITFLWLIFDLVPAIQAWAFDDNETKFIDFMKARFHKMVIEDFDFNLLNKSSDSKK